MRRGGDAFVTEDSMRNACGLKPRPQDGGDGGLGNILGEETVEDTEAAWWWPQPEAISTKDVSSNTETDTAGCADEFNPRSTVYWSILSDM
jgi:hypothetical protein